MEGSKARRFVRHNAVALLALFVALGGSATAAKLISGKQIKNGSITTKDLSKGTRAALGGKIDIVVAQDEVQLNGGTGDDAVGSAFALCPAGTKPLGGGVDTLAINGDFIGNTASIDTTKQLGWYVAADNRGPNSTPTYLRAFAYCAKNVASITFPDGYVGRGIATRAQNDRKVAARRAMRLR